MGQRASGSAGRAQSGCRALFARDSQAHARAAASGAWAVIVMRNHPYRFVPKTTRRGTCVWDIVDERGHIVHTGRREQIIPVASKLCRAMERWPQPAKPSWAVVEKKQLERELARKKPWQSRNYVLSVFRGMLTTNELAVHLGTSCDWVRRNLQASEWHHAYMQKGRRGDALFFDSADIINQLRANDALAARLRERSLRRYRELCGWVGKEADPDRIGWVKALRPDRKS